MGAGLIFAAIAVAWAAYLVPTWVRRGESGPTHNRSSEQMRLIGTRRVRPGAVTASRGRAGGVHESMEPTAVLAPPVSRRTARRRRRTLGLLLVTAVVLLGCAAVALVPMWTAALPLLAVLGYVVLLRKTTKAAALEHRRMLARRAASRVTVSTETLAHSVRHVSVRLDVLAGAPAVRLPAEPVVAIPVAAMEPGQADDPTWSADADNGSWQPVPVPLPTYVTAPKARRAIRTIDLSAPGAWTSGRLEEDAARAAELPAAYLPALAAAPDEDAAAPEQRRAVGD